MKYIPTEDVSGKTKLRQDQHEPLFVLFFLMGTNRNSISLKAFFVVTRSITGRTVEEVARRANL